MEITQKLLTKNPYSRPGIPLNKVTKIAVHYVGNPGSSAVANRNYFESLKDKHIYASSHYIIGLDGEIIQCIPETEIAYATYSANSYSISIENCHPGSDGKFNSATRSSLIELCADICKRYSLNPLTDIIRHYDVPKDNGYKKPCPLYWVTNQNDFIKFKLQVNDAMVTVNLVIDKELSTAIDSINNRLNNANLKAIDNCWKKVDTMPIKYAQQLVERLGSLYNKQDYSSTIDFLVDKKIIADRDLWDKKEFVAKYIRVVLIRFSKLG